MKIHITLDSVKAKAHLRQWGGEFRTKMQKTVVRAIATEAREIREDVREHVGANLSVARKSFLKGFTARALDGDKNRLPALYVGSRIPWSGMHEQGGSINKRMLIPVNGRVGRKRFKQQVTELMRGGNAFFVKNSKGNLVLMAENQKEFDRPLRKFKSHYRKTTGTKRLKRGEAIPIAVLVPRVMLKKRLNVERLVNNRIPKLSQRIEDFIATLE